MRLNQTRRDYADVFELQEFMNMVSWGVFGPDDGVGYFGAEDEFDDRMEVFQTHLPAEATHVHWFNK